MSLVNCRLTNADCRLDRHGVEATGNFFRERTPFRSLLNENGTLQRAFPTSDLAALSFMPQGKAFAKVERERIIRYRKMLCPYNEDQISLSGVEKQCLFLIFAGNIP